VERNQEVTCLIKLVNLSGAVVQSTKATLASVQKLLDSQNLGKYLWVFERYNFFPSSRLV